MTLLNGGIPAVAGFAVTYLSGYSFTASLVVAIIFISSSVAIIIPSLKASKNLSKESSSLIISAVVLEDVISLILLGLLLQNVSPITSLPLPIYFILLIASIIGLKTILPKLSRFVQKRGLFRHKENEDQIRFIIVVLMGVLLLFSALGMHPIVAAFLLGLVLSSAVSSDLIFTKLHTIGYGLFVPVFFFLIGTQMDFSVFFHLEQASTFLAVILVVSICSKIASGYLAGRLAGIDKDDAAAFGIASTIQLTTSLAATQAAFLVGIIDTSLLTAIVVLSVITTIFSPLLLRVIGHAAE